jgi:hypothetical protein
VKSRQLKLVAASIGAGAALAMGALGVAFGGGSDHVGIFSDGPEATMGETSTSSAAPTTLATSVVSPTMTAERPAGFVPGG